jgi:hypothetical protein
VIFLFRKPVSVIGNIFIYKKIDGKSKAFFYVNRTKMSENSTCVHPPSGFTAGVVDCSFSLRALTERTSSDFYRFFGNLCILLLMISSRQRTTCVNGRHLSSALSVPLGSVFRCTINTGRVMKNYDGTNYHKSLDAD